MCLIISRYEIEGKRYQSVSKTLNTKVLEDDPLEAMLYDPHRPDRATTLDHLPGKPTIGPDGEPTRDASLARRGALLPFGGYKGFGLGLFVQALGLLAGFGPNGESGYTYLFIAFKPDLLGPADVFEREVTRLIDRVKATPRQPGVDEIRIPSERAFRTRERLLREGIEIDRLVYDSLRALR